MFKNLIAGLTIVISSLNVCASQVAIDVSGLSESQVADLKAIAATKAKEAAQLRDQNNGILPKDPSAAATLVATWGQQAAIAAEGFSKALGIAAKELGITINEFLASPAGKLTAALIIWKVAGASIIHSLFVLLIITIGLILSRIMFLRLFSNGYEKVQFERFWGLWKGEKLVRKTKSIKDLEEDGEWLMLWVMIFAIIVPTFVAVIAL